MSAGVDHNFVARYERLQKDLERSVELVKKQERDLSTLKAQINKILSQFDPALNCLVDVVSAKFSAAFEKVGCSGEVKIDRRDLDFANWGIRILVSYRDGEGLQVLTASRQSGGVSDRRNAR
jgi:chromosome segregation ATPase